MNPIQPNANKLAHHFLRQGHPSAWFEMLYASANGNGRAIPWANLKPNPDLVEWLEHHRLSGYGQKALVVGCGLGDDAEELARRGFEVVAFDISPTAIEWCRKRFPNSKVQYSVADLFEPLPAWQAHFDFVLEYFTIQALPPDLHEQIVEAVARLVAPGGTLLVIALGRDAEVKVGGPPWPLSKEELDAFKKFGLREIAFEEYDHRPDSPVRKFRAQYSPLRVPS
jgi:SAM-dependent methyltransferase